MKKFTFYFWAILCAIALFPGETWGQTPTVSLNKHFYLPTDTIFLYEGQTDSTSLFATITNPTGHDTLEWHSFFPSEATVEATSSDNTKAKITGVHAGIAMIRVTIKGIAFTTTSDSCLVRVKAGIPVSGISLYAPTMVNDTLRMNVGEKDSIYATIAPNNATDKSVNWSHINPDIASVQKSVIADTIGVITANKAGTAEVRIIASNGLIKKCIVIVSNPVTGIKLDKDTLSLLVGQKDSIYATISPSNASDKTISWYAISTPNYASVAMSSIADTIGVITSGTTAGMTLIGVQCGSFKDTCVVVVTAAIPVSSINIQDSLYMQLGQKETLGATILPDNATNKKLIWSSSNPTFATVDSTGIVTAERIGSALITAMSADSTVKDSCYVTILGTPITGIRLNKEATSIAVNYSDTLKVIFTPSTATNQKVTWSTSNAAIVKVDSFGVVTAFGAGTATIYVKTQEGGFTDSCKVTTYLPDANLEVANASIIAYDNSVRVSSDKSATLRIYTISGSLYREENAITGERVIVLPRGIYIVTLGNISKKIFIQ